jgi:SPP1 gp7 family putative phage head morphogenesis protein
MPTAQALTRERQFDKPRGGGRDGVPLRLGVGAPQDVLDAARRRGVLLPSDYYGIRQSQARAMAFTVSGLASLDQLQAVKDSLDSAFEAGESFEAWRKRVLRGEVSLTLPPGRLETIFRTNMQAAYMSGRGAQVVRNIATHPFLMYTAVNDLRTRPAHSRMHGTILPVGHPWWSTHRPPCGFNCRCNVIALTAAEAQRRGVTIIPPAAQPDPGFDFDPWADVMGGVRQATKKFRARATPKLAKAADALLAEAERMLPNRVHSLDEALALGRTETRALLGQVAQDFGAGMDDASFAAAARFSELLQARIVELHGKGVPAAIAQALGDKGAAKTVAAAGALYPASWVQATNAFGPLTVYGARGASRAFQVTVDGRPLGLVKLGRSGVVLPERGGAISTRARDLRTALHEFGHRIQAANPALDRILQDYHARRTAGEQLVRMSALRPGWGYRASEVTKPDKFLDPYFGKIYGERGALEMLTMTYERLLGDDRAALLDLYLRDRELFELAVGLLTGWSP